MKIGMVLWAQFPPDIRVKRQARYLVENGHEVHLICKKKPNNPKYEDIDGIQIRRINEGSNIIGAGEELIRHTTLVSPTWYVNLRKLFWKESYDILHVHDLPPLPTTLRALRGIDTPVVADFHELYPESVTEWRAAKSRLERCRPSILFKPQSRWERIESKCITEIDGLVTVSPEQLEYYKKKYDLSQTETGVVRNVPDLKRFDQMGIEPLEYDTFTISYIGYFTPQRGLETAITAFSEFLDSVPDAKLLMVGDSNDDYITDLQSLVSEVGIENNVEFTGWVDFERVPSYMNASDVTLCTWVGDNLDSECTLPNKMFQSMLMETPVVASNLRSMENLINKTDSGLVFEQDSTSSLTEAFQKLYNNPDFRKKLGHNGKRAAESKYNIHEEGDTLVKLYQRIL
jgi:glycosyltransferase involved in cell wall biosynthesis